MSNPPLRTYAEASAWLGVPRKWLEAAVQEGKAPHTRLGKHVRFSQTHLDALVAAGEQQGPIVVPPALAGVVTASLRPSRGARPTRAPSAGQ